ncbi:MAG: energy-coupling factor transporter transmembrane protein EcfT [Lachnospiraceae bacterium]|nr:energy-coupling factor transporter transmembrane protein EcfT [Lachnospiraceae bacterium]
MVSRPRRHPLVPLTLLLSVLLIAMFAQTPLLTLSAFAGAVLYLVTAGRSALTRRGILGFLILWFLVAVTNPLFSTGGATPIVFVNGRPYTKEALLYGIHLGGMLIAVVLWFRCETFLVSDENRFFLFGRIAPKTALLISSVLRFVPLLRRRAEAMRSAQTAVGVYDDPDWLHRTRSTMTTWSALTTWSLEHAIDAGASMKARGYGLPGRTTYRTCHFTKTDAACFAGILALDAVVITALAAGDLSISYYPAIVTAPVKGCAIAGIIAYAVLSLLPFASYIKEEIRWSFYRSKM